MVGVPTVERPEPPGDQSNPVDAFIDAKLRDKGLEALPRADRRTLIRRAYFDLLGLPPTPEAVARFLADESPDAFVELVDELLASEHYGERWGRHWLDVVRYADSGGFETDIYFPNAWRYRDYVIASFNKDKPYDQFVKEQIAGDEIWPNDLELRGGYQIPEEKQQALEARIGTGLYAIGPVYHEAALDGRQLRYEWMTDAVDTTASAFMGLTLGCARCHDHKFDPLSQRDYHRMMAVFAGSEPRNEPVVHKMSELGFYTGYPKLLKVDEYKSAIKRIDAAARKRVQKEVESQFSEDVLAAYRKPKSERTAEERDRAARVEGALTAAGLKENASGKKASIDLTPKEKDERERLIYELGKAALAARFELPQATVLGKAECPVSRAHDVPRRLPRHRRARRSRRTCNARGLRRLQHRHTAPSTRGVAHRPGQPAYRQGHGQPHLAGPLRPRHRRHPQRPRPPRRRTHAPRATRLASRRVRRTWLEREGDAQADHAFRRLPARQ